MVDVQKNISLDIKEGMFPSANTVKQGCSIMINSRSSSKLTLFFLLTFFLSLSHSASRQASEADDEGDFSYFDRKRLKKCEFPLPISRRPSLQEALSTDISINATRADPAGLAEIILENFHSEDSLKDKGIFAQTVLFLQQEHTDKDVERILTIGKDYSLHFGKNLPAKSLSDILLTLGTLDSRYPREQGRSSFVAYNALIEHSTLDPERFSTLENQISYLRQAGQVFNETFGREELTNQILKSSLEWTQGTPEESEEATRLITRIALTHPHTWGRIIDKQLRKTFNYDLKESLDYLTRIAPHTPKPRISLPVIHPEVAPTNSPPSRHPLYHDSAQVKNPVIFQDPVPRFRERSLSISSSSSEPRRKETPGSSDIVSEDD